MCSGIVKISFYTSLWQAAHWRCVYFIRLILFSQQQPQLVVLIRWIYSILLFSPRSCNPSVITLQYGGDYVLQSHSQLIINELTTAENRFTSSDILHLFLHPTRYFYYFYPLFWRRWRLGSQLTCKSNKQKLLGHLQNWFAFRVKSAPSHISRTSICFFPQQLDFVHGKETCANDNLHTGRARCENNLPNTTLIFYFPLRAR